MQQYGLEARVLGAVTGHGLGADLELLEYLDGVVEWASRVFLDGDGNRDVAAIGPASAAATHAGLTITGFANGRLRLRTGAGNQCAVSFAEGSDWWQLRSQAGREAFHVLFAQVGGVVHWTHEVVAEVCRFTSLIRSPAAYHAGNATLMEHAIGILRAAPRVAAGCSTEQLMARPLPLRGEPEEVEAFRGRALLLGRQLEAMVGMTGLGDLAVAVAGAACASRAEPCGGDPCPADAAVAAWVDRHPQHDGLRVLLSPG
jgi:hypothetical protein